MAGWTRTVKSLHAFPPDCGMAYLRDLLHCPLILADGASPGSPLAGPRGLPVPPPSSNVDFDVDCVGPAHLAMASHRPLLQPMDVDSLGAPERGWHLPLPPRRSSFQLGSSGRPS